MNCFGRKGVVIPQPNERLVAILDDLHGSKEKKPNPDDPSKGNYKTQTLKYIGAALSHYTRHKMDRHHIQ